MFLKVFEEKEAYRVAKSHLKLNYWGGLIDLLTGEINRISRGRGAGLSGQVGMYR